MDSSIRGTQSTLWWWCPAVGRSSWAATKQRSVRQAIKSTKWFEPQMGRDIVRGQSEVRAIDGTSM
eukprot:9751423-Prorocentrum_lima.AAC.1